MAERQQLFSQQDADLTVRVWQQDDRRWMDFDDTVIQSEIILDRPDILPLALNRHMLAGCLFVAQPRTILLAGTGGGATARYFSHRFPNVSGDAVELSPLICDVARDYFEFPQGEQWQLHAQDINHYVADSQQLYDLIIIDIAEEELTPDWIVDSDFLQHCRSLLTEQGHIAFNLLVNDGSALMHFLSAIRAIFNGMTVCMSVPEHRNIVVFAYNSEPSFDKFTITEKLQDIEQNWGLEFNNFYQQMLKDNPTGSGVL